MRKDNSKSSVYSLRMAGALKVQLENAAESLGISKAKVLERSFSFMWRPENFITCPGCEKRKWIKEDIGLVPGEIKEFACPNCGSRFWYDNEVKRIIKGIDTKGQKLPIKYFYPKPKTLIIGE